MMKLRTIGMVLMILGATAACADANDPGEAETPVAEASADTDGSESEDDDADSEELSSFSFRYSTAAPENSSPGESIVWFFDEVEERSDGRIETELFHSATLVPFTETLEAVQDERVDLGYIGGHVYVEQFPLWSAVQLPFVTNDAGATTQAYWDLYQNDPVFQQEFESQGVRILAFIPIGSAAAGMAEPVTSLEQFDGARVRSSGFINDAVEVVGGTPVFLETGEVYESLQRGVIDGFVGFLMDTAVALSFHEVVPAFMDLGFGQYTMAAVAMSTDQWDELPEDLQQVFLDVAADYQSESLEILADFEADACDTLLDAGGSATVLGDDEVEAWRSAIGETLDEKWMDTVTAAGTDADVASEFLEDYLTLVDELDGTTGYTDGMVACAQRGS